MQLPSANPGELHSGRGIPRCVPFDRTKNVETHREAGRKSMGAKTKALATQFGTKARDAVATLERLSDGDWRKVTASGWTVGVTAHHLAGSLDTVASIVTG